MKTSRRSEIVKEMESVTILMRCSIQLHPTKHNSFCKIADTYEPPLNSTQPIHTAMSYRKYHKSPLYKVLAVELSLDMSRTS